MQVFFAPSGDIFSRLPAREIKFTLMIDYFLVHRIWRVRVREEVASNKTLGSNSEKTVKYVRNSDESTTTVI